MTLTHPVELTGDEEGWLTGMRCVRMELGEPDASGRRRPLPIAGSEFLLPMDMVIVAIGTGANPIVQESAADLETDGRGYIRVDPETMQTSKKGVFAGGDIVTGAATVILAMGAGRKAARSIDAYLRSEEALRGT
jgi:glutamate synthase (NADPH/NADH) small chain